MFFFDKSNYKDMPHFGYFRDLGGSKKEIVSDCTIGNVFAHQSGEKQGNYVGKAIWDTGATHSCISHKVVEELELRTTGQVEGGISTASGIVPAYKYAIDLIIHGFGLGHGVVEVIGTNLSDDMLIGMDIIGMGDFAICGGRYFSYCCPPCPTLINLKEKADRVNHNDKKKRKLMGAMSRKSSE